VAPKITGDLLAIVIHCEDWNLPKDVELEVPSTQSYRTKNWVGFLVEITTPWMKHLYTPIIMCALQMQYQHQDPNTDILGAVCITKLKRRTGK
jgi:hypothetical protein